MDRAEELRQAGERAGLLDAHLLKTADPSMPAPDAVRALSLKHPAAFKTNAMQMSKSDYAAARAEIIRRGMA